MKLFLAVAAIAILAVPAVSAQAPTGMTLTAGPVQGTITEDKYNVTPYMGTVNIPVIVKVGCGTIVAHSDSPKVTVTVDPAPAWLTVTPVVLDFAPSDSTVVQGCATGSGFTQKTAPLPITLKADAPGIVVQNLPLKATMNSATSPADAVAPATATAPIQVQFHPNYTIEAKTTFPVTVNCGKAAFDVVMTNRGNARNMIMIEEKQESTGSLSGVGPETYEPLLNNGTDTKTFKAEFKAPSNWTTATVMFKAYSHFLIPPAYGAGDFRAQQNITWTFTKGSDEGCAPTCPAGSTDPACTSTTKDSPAALLPAYITALAVGAFVASRRKK